MEGVIVFTQVKGDLQKINYNNGDSWRYLSEAQIVALDPKDSKENVVKMANQDTGMAERLTLMVRYCVCSYNANIVCGVGSIVHVLNLFEL